MEIRSLAESGVSISEIARTMGIDRKTARKYARSETYRPYVRRSRRSRLDPYKDHIRQRLEQYPLSCVRLYDEILLKGYNGKMTVLRDFVRELRHEKAYHAVLTFETAPGQQAQVDWAHTGKIQTAEGEQKLYCFCMVLGHSRMRYVEFTHSMNLEVLIQCHINAFKYFGGAPHEILYDNMKQVVLKRARTASESDFSPLFTDFMSYYGISVKLCRVRKPRTKGKVEKLVDYVKDNLFLGLEFTGLADLNMKAGAWLDRVNGQVHATTGKIPMERLKEESSSLIRIDGRPDYRISQVLYRKARCNCLVSIFSAEYSVPPKYANRDVEVRLDPEHVDIFYRGELIARHRRVSHGISFDADHRAQLEQNCYYFPRINSVRREGRQVEVVDQSVESRDLGVYEGCL